MNKSNEYNLFGIEINNLSYNQILDEIEYAICNNLKISICYVNVNSINISFGDEILKKLYSSFDFIHPDGVGVFLASKFIFGKTIKAERLTGSDLYQQIIEKATNKNWKLFIFGDTKVTLDRIRYANPELKIVGSQNGYSFDNSMIFNEINNANPDLLIVGLGTPKQEKWIAENKSNLKVNVIIAVGDGIKVFAGNKRRGSKILQKLGFEWFVRFIYEPKRLWKRYFIGIPLFIFRVIKFKFLNTKNG